MNFLAKLFGRSFDRAAVLQAELDRMQTVLRDIRNEREGIVDSGAPEKSAGRLAEIAALEIALERRMVAGRIPLLRLRVEDLTKARDAANVEWVEAKRRQHNIASQFETMMEGIYNNKHDAKLALKMRPESVRVALLTRGEAKEKLNECERQLRLADAELQEAIRASAKAQRQGLFMPEPVPHPVAEARAAVGMPPPEVVGDASPLPAATV